MDLSLSTFLLLSYSWGVGHGHGIDNNGASVEASYCEDHASLTRNIHDLLLQHSSISSIYSIGNSTQGRTLWVMSLGDSVNLRPLLRPQVKLVGNINGFSSPACHTLLLLVKRLLEGYRKPGSQERRLLQSLEIHVLFDMNPDGYAKTDTGSCSITKTRGNGKGVDLNRDFPHAFPDHQDIIDDQHPQPHPLQPETKAVVDWSMANNFILSLSFTSGHALVVIPFDDQLDIHATPGGHTTPDDDIFKTLAEKYVDKLGSPPSSWNCPNLDKTFTHGWVNGAEWYPARGTMMDFSYVLAGTPELTIGLDCCRNPPDRDSLDLIYLKHVEAILSVLWDAALTGVRGQIVDTVTGDVLEGAMLSRIDRSNREPGVPWYTSPQGEFWRLLPSGTHLIEVSRIGYRTTRVEIDMEEGGQFSIVTIQLNPIKPSTTTIITSAPLPTTPTAGNSTTTTTATTPALTSPSPHPSEETGETATTTTTPTTKSEQHWVQGLNRGLGVMLAFMSSSSAPFLTMASSSIITQSLLLLSPLLTILLSRHIYL